MLDHISLEDCQSILQRASDSSLHEGNDIDIAFDAVEIIQSLASKTSDVAACKELTIKYTAACIWILKTSLNLDDCICAFACYLTLMRSPMFGSLGCRSLGIRKFILLCFSKTILKTLKGTNDSSTLLRLDLNGIENGTEEDNVDAMDTFQSHRLRRAAAIRVSSKRLKSSNSVEIQSSLQQLIDSFNENLSCMLENADEDFVSIMAESLIMLVQAVQFSDDWKNSSQNLTKLFSSFVSYSSETVLSLHQCMMPGISYCFDRSSLYSDSAKLRASVHSALIEIYNNLVPLLLSTNYQSHISRTVETMLSASFEASSTSTTPAKSRRNTPKATPSSVKSTKSNNDSVMNVDGEVSMIVTKEFSTGPECLLSSLQRMTLLCPDRANVRQIVAKSIVLVVNAVASAQYGSISNKVMAHFINFLTRLTRSNRAQHRSFALDIVCNLIQEESIWKYGLDSSDLLQVLMARCADQSPVVRLKALSTIYDVLSNCEDSSRFHTLYNLVTASSGSLLDTVQSLTTETKPMLRTKALQVLTCIITKDWLRPTEVTKLIRDGDENSYFKLPLAEEDVQAIANACSDVSVAVRKQAVHCLTELLKAHPNSKYTLSAWVMTALPLIIDTESTVVQKVASVFEDVVLSSLSDDFSSAELSVGWKVLYQIGEVNMIQILKHIVGYLIRNGIIVFERNSNVSFYRLINMCKTLCEKGLISADCKPTSSDSVRYYDAAWILMEVFASHCGLRINNAKGELIIVEEQFRKVGSTSFIFEAFRRNCAKSLAKGVGCSTVDYDDNFVRILKVLDKFLATLSDNELSFVALEIKTRLNSLSIQAPIAALMISIQFQISKIRAENVRTLSLVTHVNSWVSPLMEKVFQQLKSFAFGITLAAQNDTMSLYQPSQLDGTFLGHDCNDAAIMTMRMVQIGLFVIGEISMLGFKMDETPMKLLVSSQAENESAPLVSLSQDAVGSVRVRFANRVSEMLQLFMAKTLPGSDGQGHLRCPNPIRAVAFLTVGKLCMRDHVLARDSLNVFLRELTFEEENSSQAEISMSALSEQSFLTQTAIKNSVRNNALLVLADLCIRHTHLVDRHIDTLACCLQDRDAMIRRNALMLISQLLMQDFVKLKGLLLYRFLMLTVDEDEELALFSKEVIERSLCVKYPGILVNHFSEALIILNKCSEHPIYSAVAFAAGQDNAATMDDHAFTQAFAIESTLDMDPNTKAFHASADLTRAQRFQIYSFMATNISDETKIQITAKLVNDILASAIDHSQRLLPDRNNISISHSAMKKYGHNQRESLRGTNSTTHFRSLIDFTRFETAIEDVLIFLRSPVLKIGSKKKNGADNGEEALLEDGQDATTSTAGQIAQAKTKILKALSSQHMISHVLPVVMSLKHVLEQFKSPLQGALMEYLLSLVKHHSAEVEQALQYDPTLKAEIEFDLRQFERLRKEQQQQINSMQRGSISASKNSMSGATPRADRVSPSSVMRMPLLTSTVQKPVLKSVHKATGVKSSERRILSSVRFDESAFRKSNGEEEDPMLRVLSQPEEIAADDCLASSFHDACSENISAISNRFSLSSGREGADLSHLSMLSETEDDDLARQSNSSQKRRSWGVVLTHLSSSPASKPTASEANDVQDNVPARKRSRTNSRGNSLGNESRTFSAQSTKSVGSSHSASSNALPVFLLLKESADDNSMSLPKKLDSIFATADDSVLMPPPAAVAGGKRSSKSAPNSLMMSMR